MIAVAPDRFPAPPPEMPCIRCGRCAQACPCDLQPLELFWFANSRNFDKARAYKLFDCIECGCCSYVCPSHIPLVSYYRFAKGEIATRDREKQAAEQARARFEFKRLREEQARAERSAKLAERNAAAKAAAAESAADPAAAAKKAAIRAAVERVKAQKEAAARLAAEQAATPDPTDRT